MLLISDENKPFPSIGTRLFLSPEYTSVIHVTKTVSDVITTAPVLSNILSLLDFSEWRMYDVNAAPQYTAARSPPNHRPFPVSECPCCIIVREKILESIYLFACENCAEGSSKRSTENIFKI